MYYMQRVLEIEFEVPISGMRRVSGPHISLLPIGVKFYCKRTQFNNSR